MGPSRPTIGREELAGIREGLRIMALKVLRDPATAEDAAQESMARLLEALEDGRLEDPSRITAYARGIARHVIVDLQRTRGDSPPSGPRLHRTEPPSPEPSPLAGLISRERRELVRDALASLSDRDREVLRLSFFEGLTSAEIASRRGEPPARIRKRKSRALQRLRRALVARSQDFGGQASHRTETRTPRSRRREAE